MLSTRRLGRVQTLRDPGDLPSDRYSLGRALLSAAGLWAGPTPERDLSDELSRELPEGLRPRDGIFVPHKMLGDMEPGGNGRSRVRALTTAAGGAGAEFVFEEPGPFAAALRTRSVAARLGATFVEDLVGNLRIRRGTSGVDVVWTDEDPGSDVSSAEPGFEQEVLSPHTLSISIPITRQLLRQAAENPDAEEILREDVSGAVSEAVDAAVFAGAGDVEPTGLFNRADVTTVAIAADGGAPTWATVTELEETAAAADGDVDPESSAYITTPQVRRKLRNTEKLGAGSGPVWEGDRVAGHRGAVSTAVPSDLSKGAGTNLHGIGYGFWSQLLIAVWGPGVEFVVDPFTRKRRGEVEVTAFWYGDLGLIRPESFATVEDADPT